MLFNQESYYRKHEVETAITELGQVLSVAC